MNKNSKMKFSFFGPAVFLHACFYALCMYRNSNGVAFPFFVAGSLWFFCFCLSKLEISLKKGSAFYLIAIGLLAVSSYTTDDSRIVFFNKVGMILLLLCFLLKQFYDTREWGFLKYTGSIFYTCTGSLGRIARPFTDIGKWYREEKGSKGKLLPVLIGLCAACPILALVLVLLSDADVVFRKAVEGFFDFIQVGNILGIFFTILIAFLGVYALLAYFCDSSRTQPGKTENGLRAGKPAEDEEHPAENAKQAEAGINPAESGKLAETGSDPEEGAKVNLTGKKTGKADPAAAITVTGLLTIVYLFFAGIQILYLFIGKMQLPDGYTYAQYAREGFFQLLAVSMLNFVIVCIGMTCFAKSRILRGVLTAMTVCTFVMIASSAVRMLLYIMAYHLTFLRILVLWFLLVLTFLFAGVLLALYRQRFPLFTYSCVIVTCFYLCLSFAHPDYWIARVNVQNGAAQDAYLAGLCADAAPVLLNFEPTEELEENVQRAYRTRLLNKEEHKTLRQKNLSLWIAGKILEKEGY